MHVQILGSVGSPMMLVFRALHSEWEGDKLHLLDTSWVAATGHIYAAGGFGEAAKAIRPSYPLRGCFCIPVR
jgi:hypothetical protein